SIRHRTVHLADRSGGAARPSSAPHGLDVWASPPSPQRRSQRGPRRGGTLTRGLVQGPDSRVASVLEVVGASVEIAMLPAELVSEDAVHRFAAALRIRQHERYVGRRRRLHVNLIREQRAAEGDQREVHLDGGFTEPAVAEHLGKWRRNTLDALNA